MEEIKLKPEFEAKLKELGVYEKWCFNFKNRKPEDGLNMSINELNSYSSFEFFIAESFYWRNTPEKADFWHEISESKIEPKSQLKILKEWIEAKDKFSQFTYIELINKIEEIEKI